MCALATADAGGQVACVGTGTYGKLGRGNDSDHHDAATASTENIGDDKMPVEWGKVATGIDVVRVYTGVQHTCALSSSAQVVCWGSGYVGYPNIWWGVGDDEVPASAGLVPYL